MVSTEAVQVAVAIEPDDGWPALEAEAAVETAADEMIEAGMHPARVEELLGDILRSAMGEMG